MYFYGARYYDPVIGRFITADTIVQAPFDPQSFNRYAYCRNNPLKYVDPSGHWFWFAVIGAIIGAASAAATGGNIGLGALAGFFGGALFAGAGAAVSAMHLQGLAAAGMFAGAGAISGVASAAMTGGNIGIGALTGALGGALGYGASFIDGPLGLLAGLSSGAVVGGLGSVLLGGNFGDGAWRGAASAGIAYTVSAVGREINKESKAQAEKQSQQREAPQTQAKLDAGYAEGGVEGQMKAAAKVAVANSAPEHKIVVSSMTETSTAEYWMADYLSGDPTQIHVTITNYNKAYNYTKVPSGYVLMSKTEGPNVCVKWDFRLIVLYQDFQKITKYDWGPLNVESK